MTDPMLERPAVGKDEQTLAIRVETARGVDAGRRNEVLEVAVSGARAELTDDPVRLVEQQDTTRRTRGPRPAGVRDQSIRS